MRTFQLTNPLDSSILKEKMANSKNNVDYKHLQILYLISNYDVNAAFLSDITGYSIANIYTIVQQHNKPKSVPKQQRGGRRRFYLSEIQEKELMQGLEEKAMKGIILSYLDIKKIVEKRVGKSVSDDFIWDLFKRNGWTKHSPRPHHPKKDSNAQEMFKKNSKTIWMPLKMILERS